MKAPFAYCVALLTPFPILFLQLAFRVPGVFVKPCSVQAFSQEKTPNQHSSICEERTPQWSN
eukprot:374035-Pelagomonas_calceolata.AAC.15